MERTLKTTPYVSHCHFSIDIPSKKQLFQNVPSQRLTGVKLKNILNTVIEFHQRFNLDS